MKPPFMSANATHATQQRRESYFRDRAARFFPPTFWAGILLCVGVVHSHAFDASSFAPHLDIPANSGQVNVAIGDLNGDGKPDAVVGNFSDASVSIYRNTSTAGTVSFAPRVNLSVGNTPHCVLLADLDGDGKLDIICVNQASSTISLLRNTSIGGINNSNSFAAKINLVVGSDPRWAAATDLNNDGKSDLVVSSYASGMLSVFENNGTPGTLSFSTRVDLSTSAGSGSVETGDLDGDGKSDIVVGSADYPVIWIYRNVNSGGALTTGSFAARVQLAVGGGPRVALADLDGDGKLDLVSANATAHNVSVLRNTASSGSIGTNSFAPRVNFAVGYTPFSAAIDDLDGDGTPDIAVANADSQSVSVFKGLATPGSFDTTSLGAKVDYTTGAGLRAVSIADLDGDGLLDMATGNSSQNSFSVLKQLTISPPPPPPTNGPPSLVALWHGDGDAQDAVGSNHGTLMGGAGFTQGAVGQGFMLDGVNSFIRVPDSASLHLANELTVELWFKRATSSSWGTLIDKRNWTTCNYGVIMSDPWGFQVYYNDPNIWDGNMFEISFSSVPAPGGFHHFAGTFRQVDSGHVEVKTYMDGQLVQTDTLRGDLATTFNGDALSFGVDRDGAGGSFFHGVIDEVALYNYALSPAQVLSNFSNVTPPPPPPPPTNTPGSLVALWHADGDAQDAVGSNHGTLMGGAGFAQGAVGQGFMLDGANDYIRIPDSASLHLADELTVEMWFKRESSSSYGTLIDKRNWTTCNYGVIMSAPWGFQVYYNDPNIWDGNMFELSFSSVPAPGGFHHLAATYRQADSGHVEVKTYMDGQLVRTDTLRGNLANTFNGDALSFGVDRDGAGGSFFYGVIDEVALYNYALSPAQVLSNFSNVTLPPPPPPPPPPVPALVSLWHGDGDAQDAVGSNHGALMGGAGFTQGAVGQGFMLDGVNDYIRVPDSASLHLANELTIEMWFMRDDSSSYGTLIDKRNWTTCNYGVIISDPWGFQVYYNDPNIWDGNMFEISFSSVPAPGVFHHFAGTFRQVDSGHVEVKTYMDGQLVRTDTLRGDLATTFNGDALSFGVDRDGAGGSFFHGVIDEVALYNYALSPSQVYSNYSSVTLLPPPPPPPPPTNTPGSLVALWHGDGDAQDAVGSNHGTLMGGAGFAQGAVGQGFMLDGANDYIRIPDSASLHLADELTVEMWFKRETSSSYGALIDKRNWTTCNYGVFMSAPWGFQVYYNDPNINDGNMFELSFSSVPAPGVFHHLAATYRQVDSGHVEVKTYMDGQLVRTDTLRGNLANTFNSDALSFGVDRDGAGGAFFHGVIDEVALYNYALSPAQVLSNYVSTLNGAPQIISQPASLTVVQGDPASFLVGVVGASPLRYQWRYAGGDLAGETNNSFTLPAAQLSDAGGYDVVVANDSGSVTSAVATLTVSESGLPPSFVTAPSASYSASSGETVTMGATVSGTPPFLFQWTFDGVALPGATNINLVLNNVQPENAGTYRLFVTNAYGGISSSGSTLSITYGGGGTFFFQNFSTNLVLDVGGAAGVPGGTGYVAAVFMGLESDALTQVGTPAGFLFFPGRFNGGIRTVPFATAGQTVFAEVRVWNLTVSSTYEEAVALGGKHGSSGIFQVTLGGGIALPGQLFGMNGFSLEAGTGIVGRRKIQSASGATVTLAGMSRANGETSFVLASPAGAALVVEASTDLVNWVVVGQMVNNSGAVKFVDESAGGHRFYRARIANP